MEVQDFFIISVSIFGFISVFKSSIRFLRWVWVMFLRPSKNLKDYGSWAIVTGSTDGIGKAIAFDLASRGLNLVLIGRNPSKLEATSSEIHERFVGKIGMKNIVIDLAKSSGEEITQLIEEGIRGLDVGILINNAGVSFPYAKFFHEVDLELMESIRKVNIEAATWITRSVLRGMLKKKKGAIVNIGSGSTVVGSSYPLYSDYAASKAYLAMFSRCIGLEYKQHGIHVQCQIPLLVATKMSKLKATSFFIPSPEMYSKASAGSIGYELLSVPCWSHSVQCFLLDALPDAFVNWSIYSYFLGMRKRGQKKDSQKAKLQEDEGAAKEKSIG